VSVQIALVALLPVLVVLVLGVLAVQRRHTLKRRVGSFSCALLVRDRWVSGVAHYGARDLYWWRTRTLSPRPEHVWPRGAIAVVERRRADAGSTVGPLLVRCAVGHGEEVRLMMSAEAYAGLTSWLEAAPPVARTVI
jgi:hypothetical protein